MLTLRHQITNGNVIQKFIGLNQQDKTVTNCVYSQTAIEMIQSALSTTTILDTD